MKLLTNSNNLNALKVIIASKIAGKSVEIQIDSTENLFKHLKSPKTVPQLILESGTHIFSSNSAAKYLFQSNSPENSAVDYYLDLDATILQPLTLCFTTKANDAIKKLYEEILNLLSEELSDKKFLTGNDLSVGDIVIWCTLFPVYTDKSKYSQIIESRPTLNNWFERLHKNEKFKEAFAIYSVQDGLLSVENSCINFNSLKNTTISSILNSEPSQKNSEVLIFEKPILAVTPDEKKLAAASFSEKFIRTLKKRIQPVLPVPGERNNLITSALPYVNNVPHLGNIIGCVLSADVFARYSRMRGYNTLYISGTDEYGTATETKALEEGLSPSEICDKYFKIHDSIYKWFNIKFDYFGRTTTPQQTQICQDIFKKVYNNGYILADCVDQLLCKKCDRYLADRFVEGTCPRCAFVDARGDQCDGCGHLINAVELIEPRCKMCKEKPVLQQSKQFFLDLPKIEPVLKTWIEKSWLNWSHNAREISKAWLNDGLKPRCITRDLKWGIPVPLEGFENKVFYVWFDAPIGYISITSLYTEEWRKWWLPESGTKVNLYQFMAKDNVPFHSIMFPASLLATKENYLTVDNIFATEYLNYEHGKFSKSRGLGVFGNDARDTNIPADVWRFYLLYVRPESQDSSFSWTDLALKNNSELLNNLGNFVNRALVFCEKTYNSVVPRINLTDEDNELLALVNRELNGYVSVMEKGKLREGIRHLLAIARLGNQFMQASKPWVLSKGSDDDKRRCETVIALSINLAGLLSQLLDPYMPGKAEDMRKQLNAASEIKFIEDKFRMCLPPGHKIGKPFPLFAEIDSDEIEKLRAKYSGRQKSGEPTMTAAVDEEKKEKFSALEGNVASLEAAVAAQGDLVRQMKASGKSKSEWEPQVTVLLDLKKRLAEAKQKSGRENLTEANGMNVNEVETTVGEMEEKVKNQVYRQNTPIAGDKVRKLKESGADKTEWQPEVNVLLELKKQLAQLKGEPVPDLSKKKNKKK